MDDDDGEMMGWMIGRLIGMIILQSLLLILHRSSLLRPRPGQPTPAELFVGISFFWAVERSTERVLAALGAALSVGLSEFSGKNRYGSVDFDQHYAELGVGYMRPDSLWSEASGLCKIVFISWNIYQGLIFALDTGIPLLQEFQQHPQKAIQRLDLRYKELSRFLEGTFRPMPSYTEDIPLKKTRENMKAGLQTIHLQRHRTDGSTKGERRLSWSVSVDKVAMDEMKETLGPPGGFGELGFNVAKDGVRFEAMGVGTSFNLMFKLREDDGDIKFGSPRRRKAVHFS